MDKRVTLKDIAAALGVTTMTVSKALNNHPDISDARKKEILVMAEKMNYVPNALAKNLRTKSSSLIGVIVADNSNPYFASFIKGKSNDGNNVFFNLITKQLSQRYF